MEEWSFLTNGSVLDLAETSDADPINGGSVGSVIEFVKDGVECVFGDDDRKGNDIDTVKDVVGCVNADDDEYKVRLRCTFDQVLSVFLKEIGDRGVVRPVPAVFGDRQHVDLFKLFCVVRDEGGYDLVSRRRLWSYVSKELGLDNGATAASVKLIYFKYLNELEIWFRESCTEQKDNGDGLVHLDSDRNGKFEYGLSDNKDACIMHSATQLGDVSIGEIPEPAKWKKHQGNEFWFQAIKAREALMLRRDLNPKTEELPQQELYNMPVV
ncbi:hypothetical protein ACLB2K_043643 [Fragaria x ananassa]